MRRPDDDKDLSVSMSVRFLGTGDAFNNRGRCHASYLVAAPSTTLLLDCGASALVAMQRDGVNIDHLDAVCLSHLHGDHFAGLPFLFIAATYDVPRRRPLTIVGPPGTQARVRELFRAMYRDLSAKQLPFEVHYI
jgi:ribonuclease BN (tRNA processing enzyme)